MIDNNRYRLTTSDIEEARASALWLEYPSDIDLSQIHAEHEDQALQLKVLDDKYQNEKDTALTVYNAVNDKCNKDICALELDHSKDLCDADQKKVDNLLAPAKEKTDQLTPALTIEVDAITQRRKVATAEIREKVGGLGCVCERFDTAFYSVDGKSLMFPVQNQKRADLFPEGAIGRYSLDEGKKRVSPEAGIYHQKRGK